MSKIVNLLLITCICAGLAGCSSSSSGRKTPDIQGPLVMHGDNVSKEVDATTVTSAIKQIDGKKNLDGGTSITLTLEDGNCYEVFVPRDKMAEVFYSIEDVFNDKFVFEGYLSEIYESSEVRQNAHMYVGKYKERRFPKDFALIDKAKLYEAEQWLARNKPETEPEAEWTTARIVYSVLVYRPLYFDPYITCLVYTDNGQRFYLSDINDITGLGKEPFDLAGKNIEYKFLCNESGKLVHILVQSIK